MFGSLQILIQQLIQVFSSQTTVLVANSDLKWFLYQLQIQLPFIGETWTDYCIIKIINSTPQLYNDVFQNLRRVPHLPLEISRQTSQNKIAKKLRKQCIHPCIVELGNAKMKCSNIHGSQLLKMNQVREVAQGLRTSLGVRTPAQQSWGLGFNSTFKKTKQLRASL